LREGEIVGELTWTHQSATTPQSEVENVVLKREESDFDPGQEFRIKTLGDWVTYAANILRRRGPRW
jgi:hypothetical protein